MEIGMYTYLWGLLHWLFTHIKIPTYIVNIDKRIHKRHMKTAKWTAWRHSHQFTFSTIVIPGLPLRMNYSSRLYLLVNETRACSIWRKCGELMAKIASPFYSLLSLHRRGNEGRQTKLGCAGTPLILPVTVLSRLKASGESSCSSRPQPARR